MRRHYGLTIMTDRARYERERTIDPRHEEPPHGDVPYFDGGAFRDMDRDANDSFANVIFGIIGTFVIFLALLILAFTIWMPWAHAADDGRYADSSLKPWFDKLASKKGLCCSFADGRSITDADTDIRGDHFWVRVDGQWIEVPDAALVTEPNKVGTPVVWPYQDAAGATQIRCFLPGSGA